MELPKHNVMKYFLEGVHIHIFDVHATMIAYDIFEKFKQFEDLKNGLRDIFNNSLADIN